MLVVISVITVVAAILTWIAAMPIEREIVFLATTIALIISLVLVVNVVVLFALRLQRRVSHLEGVLAETDTPLEKDREDQVVVVTLTNRERRVLNRLEENGGRMGQDELKRITGMSKSTLSVTLSTLERKSLISREVVGRTKLVILERTVTR